MFASRVSSTILATAFVLLCAHSANAEFRWPTWLGGKPEKPTTTHRKTTKPIKPTNTNGTGKSKNLFAGNKSMFSSKPKSKIISKWPSAKSKADSGKAKKGEKESWLGSMFKPKEPEPPRNVAEWMDLPQIKP